MKYAYLGVGFISFGLCGLIFILLFQSVTVNNEAEYYVLKEAMEAAMLESVDLVCYRIGNSEGMIDIDSDGDGELDTTTKGACGDHDLKIIEQKFVENFTKRFAASIMGDATNYTLEFYDIIESPPKATVKVIGKTKSYTLSPDSSGSSYNIVNDLSGILELYNN